MRSLELLCGEEESREDVMDTISAMVGTMVPISELHIGEPYNCHVIVSIDASYIPALREALGCY